MFKKMASLLSLGKKRPGKLALEKNITGAQNQGLLDEYVYRYPPFPKGIPATPIETIMDSNQVMIQQIILARGLAGKHNAKAVELQIVGPIRHLAEMAHLLPASEKNHFRTPGGLVRFSLESALFGIRYAERRILTRVTPEIRRDNEALWTHAAFLTGLFSESILVISRISVYSEEGGIEWHPGMESIYQWLQRHQLKSYHLRWSEKEDRSMIYALAGKTIQAEQTEMLAQGEKAIYKTLLSALHDQEDLNNPLVKINRSVKYKLIERDEASDPSRYGKPLAGMHLDPWLIDAMRHLVEKKRWVVNEENGRCWHGEDGVYLVWPLAASDMQQELKASESPFVPNTTEILAELMQEAGIIERASVDGGYLFDIAIPRSDNPERKPVTAIRLVRHEILFEKIDYTPLAIKLQINFDEELNQDNPKAPDNKAFEESSEEDRGYSDDEDYTLHSAMANPALTEKCAIPGDNNISLGLTSAQEASVEKIDMGILFQKPEKTGDGGRDDIEIPSESIKSKGHESDCLFGSQLEEPEANEYDDDYASSYPSESEVYPRSLGELKVNIDDRAAREKRKEPIARQAALSESKRNATQEAPPSQLTIYDEPPREQAIEDLLDALIGPAKTKNNDKLKLDGGTQKSPVISDIEKLFGDSKSQEKKSSDDDLSARSGIVLDRLKKLPPEYLELRPGGITKVTAKGLKPTQLKLKDCVSVLKASGLLVFVEGLETGVDYSGEKRTQYFLVKADLTHGR